MFFNGPVLNFGSSVRPCAGLSLRPVSLSLSLRMGVMASSPCAAPRQASVLCCGLDNAGKSTILSHLSEELPSVIHPTAGMELQHFVKYGVEWRVWDCSGTGPSRNMWPLFYPHALGVIFVVDVSDRARISCAKDELEALLLHPEFRRRNFSLLILLNKIDLGENTMTAVEIETILRLKHLQVSQRNVELHVQSCSAIKGTGIEEAFRWLGDSISSSG